jgi:pyridoxal phosphate enzyme (YggS family)
MTIVDKLKKIHNNILSTASRVTVIAVSKTFPLENIQPLIDYGHIHYGENRVAEAIEKWSKLLIKNKNLKIHLIGKLQTNKVKEAVKIFSYIHSLDSERLALRLDEEQKKINKKIKYFIQINIGNEDQKSGVAINDADNFINFCRNNTSLDIIGLMCIPPLSKDGGLYFSRLKDIAKKNKITELSMGMSSDYMDAIKNGSTFVRIGSSIFGDRS